MRKLIILLAVTAMTAPALAGCIVISTERPSTRVVHTSTEAQD